MRQRAVWTAMAGLVLFAIAACGGSSPQPEIEPVASQDPPAEQPGPDPNELAEAAARSICEQAADAARQGDYARARRLYERALAEYEGTECARTATGALERVDAMLTLAQRIHFDFDRADLTDDAILTLNRKAEVLRRYPEALITIEGHCDERGSIEYNIALGMRRAQAAKNYLVGLGLQADRFTTVSFGKERPVDIAHTERAWAINRRDEFVLRNTDAL